MRTNVLVVDDFLPDPDAVRERALALPYATDLRYYQGHRSPSFPAHKEAFEGVLGRAITRWDYPANGCFQWTTPEDRLVYHMDTQDWAAALYLTPDAPRECGTSFFESRVLGYRMDPRLVEPGGSEADYATRVDRIFAGGFFDKTRFIEVDRVGNVYNRLVLWNARMIHAASGYFGQTLEDARLVQLFFFDA